MTKINNLSTCQITKKGVGQTITLSATPSSGFSPYTVNFYKDGIQLGLPIINVTENKTVLQNYILKESDLGNRTFSAKVTDSCPTGILTSPESSCTIEVTSTPVSSVCVAQQGEICIPGIGAVKTTYIVATGLGLIALTFLM